MMTIVMVIAVIMIVTAVITMIAVMLELVVQIAIAQIQKNVESGESNTQEIIMLKIKLAPKEKSNILFINSYL